MGVQKTQRIRQAICWVFRNFFEIAPFDGYPEIAEIASFDGCPEIASKNCLEIAPFDGFAEIAGVAKSPQEWCCRWVWIGTFTEQLRLLLGG